MARELEAKLKVDSHDDVRGALASLGAERCSLVVESNYILDRPDGSLRAGGTALRVRRTEPLDEGRPTALLTYKGPAEASRFKARQEHEVAVSSAEVAMSILEAAGFVVTLSFEKRRETWRLDECLVELDEVPIFGRFVEIEGPSEQAIDAVRTRLGLAGFAHVRKGYVAMLSQYCTDNRIIGRQVRFEIEKGGAQPPGTGKPSHPPAN